MMTPKCKMLLGGMLSDNSEQQEWRENKEIKHITVTGLPQQPALIRSVHI